ncbi:MAG: hypothetical protein N2Z76_08675 [Treponemataceae bacterium]|nr:hypothetical protein [Treponemataceae bacterium]
MGLLQRIQKITNEEGALFDPLAEQLVSRIERLGEKKEDLYTILSLLKTYIPFLFAVVGLWDREKEHLDIITAAGIGEIPESIVQKLSRYKEKFVQPGPFIALGTGQDWELDADIANATLWGYHLGTWKQRIIFLCMGTEQHEVLYLQSLERILLRVTEKLLIIVKKAFPETPEREFSEKNEEEREENDSIPHIIEQLFSRDIQDNNGFYLFKIKELTDTQLQQTKEITSSLGTMLALPENTWALLCTGTLDGDLIHHHLERILRRSLEDPIRVTSKEEVLNALS